MSNELTVKGDSSLTAVLEKDGIGDMMRPMIRQIHLFDTYVAGTAFLKDKTVLSEIREGDNLYLQREENKFDGNSILVLTSDKKKLGYVLEQDNVIFARLMDAGKKLSAKISSIERRSFLVQIKIGIYLMDF